MHRGGYWISEPQVSTIRACYLSQARGSGGGRLGTLAAPARPARACPLPLPTHPSSGLSAAHIGLPSALLPGPPCLCLAASFSGSCRNPWSLLSPAFPISAWLTSPMPLFPLGLFLGPYWPQTHSGPELPPPLSLRRGLTRLSLPSSPSPFFREPLITSPSLLLCLCLPIAQFLSFSVSLSLFLSPCLCVSLCIFLPLPLCLFLSPSGTLSLFCLFLSLSCVVSAGVCNQNKSPPANTP